MKHIKNKKTFTIIIGLLILLLTTSELSFALNEIQPPKPTIHPVIPKIQKPQPVLPAIRPATVITPKQQPDLSPIVFNAPTTSKRKRKKGSPSPTSNRNTIVNKDNNIIPTPEPILMPIYPIRTTTKKQLETAPGRENPGGDVKPMTSIGTYSSKPGLVPSSLDSSSKPADVVRTSAGGGNPGSGKLSSWTTPLWVDTENTIGSKVYIDMNNQYYFGWGQVYTVKYIGRDGKMNYVQIELKGVRGNRAAIISVTSGYKKTYEIPIKNNYMPMTEDKAIYNSSRMALKNTGIPSCPKNICKYVNK